MTSGSYHLSIDRELGLRLRGYAYEKHDRLINIVKPEAEKAIKEYLDKVGAPELEDM